MERARGEAAPYSPRLFTKAFRKKWPTVELAVPATGVRSDAW
jgi:hypothetical protein